MVRIQIKDCLQESNPGVIMGKPWVEHKDHKCTYQRTHFQSIQIILRFAIEEQSYIKMNKRHQLDDHI